MAKRAPPKELMKEDFEPNTEAARHILHPYMEVAVKAGKKAGKEATLIANKLIVEGKLYYSNSPPPFSIDPKEVMDTSVYFFAILCWDCLCSLNIDKWNKI